MYTYDVNIFGIKNINDKNSYNDISLTIEAEDDFDLEAQIEDIVCDTTNKPYNAYNYKILYKHECGKTN